MKSILYVFLLFCPLLVLGQTAEHKVIAESGDGIFSILRKQGLNPAKYYAEFVELNKENLRNGSELHLGRAYIIPYAEDSFKKTAVAVQAKAKHEKSIFKSELATISPKSTKLKNAVIYLISGNNLNNTSSSVNRITDEITVNLAQELMVHGAQVYLIKSESEKKSNTFSEISNRNTEGAMADLSQMQEYVEIINKKYLKHQGKYQRLLITRVNNDITDEYCEVSVYHHNSSENGRRIASNIQRIFNENSIESKPFKEYTEIFADKNNLYLAKNALPAITLIEIDSGEKPSIEDVIVVDSDQELLSNLITSGVLNDYADLEIEK
jgi:N-acetylmuramoyl-L-alanine amidase